MPRSRLRRPLLKDRADICRIAADFHNASAYRHLPLDLGKVDALFDNAMAHPDYFAIVVADADIDRVEGYLLAVCHDHYFAAVKTVSDAGFYITPEYRDMRQAREMLRGLERWAFDVKGAVDISLGVSSGVADAAIVRFYERLGWTRGYYGVIKSRTTGPRG